MHVRVCVCVCRYVPTLWADKTELTLEEVNKLNKMNVELSSFLSHIDPVYSLFQHGNFTCIMIKEVISSNSIDR